MNMLVIQINKREKYPSYVTFREPNLEDRAEISLDMNEFTEQSDNRI